MYLWMLMCICWFVDTTHVADYIFDLAIFCFVNELQTWEGKGYLKAHLTFLYHPNSAYSQQSWRGPSNCVNSSGNCVWPLTVSVIASLFQYFAWQSERLTPEGWRPGALRLTGRGLLKAPLVHLPAWAALSCRWSCSIQEGEWEAAAFS